MFGGDPGPCAICGAAHTACTSSSGPIVVAQLPARDAAAARTSPAPRLGTVAAPVADGAEASDSARLGDGTDRQPFTTATYRGAKKKRGPSSRPITPAVKE